MEQDSELQEGLHIVVKQFITTFVFSVFFYEGYSESNLR
jgi:hypothetical protein